MGCCSIKSEEKTSRKELDVKKESIYIETEKFEPYLYEIRSNWGIVKYFISRSGESNIVMKKHFIPYESYNLKDIAEEVEFYKRISKLSEPTNSFPTFQGKKKDLIYLGISAYCLQDLMNQHSVLLEDIKANLKELLSILSKDFKELARLGIHHLSLNPNHIFVNKSGYFKIIGYIIPNSFDKYSDIIHEKNKQQIYKNEIIEDGVIESWLAPELCIAQEQGVEPFSYNPELVDVYNLALCLYLACFPDACSSFDLSNIQALPHPLGKIISAMLSKEAKLRPSFSEILFYLENQDEYPGFLVFQGRLLQQKPSYEIYTEGYERKIHYCYYFDKLFEVNEFTMKKSEGENAEQYINNMVIIGGMSESSNAFLKLYEIFKEEENPNHIFLVSEYYENNFRKVIAEYTRGNARYSDESIWAFCWLLIPTFKAISDMNFRHGNIKPENLLLTNENMLKIAGFTVECLDFMMEKNYELDQSVLAYRAPELRHVLPIEDSIDYEKIDVFALGVTLLHIFTLEEFGSLDGEERIRELLDKYGASDWFNKLMMKMLAEDPKERSNFTQLEEFLNNPNL